MVNEAPSKRVLEAAYALLARRPHSRQELKKKLAGKGFNPDHIKHTLERLSSQGYVDDEKISLNWAQSLIRNRGWGRAKIKFYLSQKGISRDVIDKVQEKIRQDFSEDDIARKALEKRFIASGGRSTRGKAAMFLKSRGFSAEIIYKVLSAFTEET